MGIDVPELDDRTYEDYLEQAKKLIPAYSEEWTDFNPHDPGITILEVLAWLTETHAYQLDQVTDKHRKKYLRLMGYRPRPVQSASAQISLSPQADAVGERIPSGTRLTVTDSHNDTYRFETDHDVALTDVAIDRVVTIDSAGRTDNSQENETEGMFFRAFGNPVEEDDAVYLGFDGDPFAAARTLTLVARYHDEDLPEPTPDHPDDPLFRPTVELVWEYRPPTTSSWIQLDVEHDGTRALYAGGSIELSLPDEATVREGNDWDLSDDFVWLRCRVVTDGYEIPPQLEAIEPNVVSASHRATVTEEALEQIASLSEPTALDGQTYRTEHAPIRSVTVHVDGQQFTEVPDFDASQPDDPHYVVDRSNGTITFGDGEHGRVPHANATVTADYVYGGGASGNVSADAIWQFENPAESIGGSANLEDIDIVSTTAATGGEDRETIEAAVERLRRDLRTPSRGVTAADYESLARRTPGVRVGQVTTFVDDAQISIVVVPYAPTDITDPEPSEGFLRAVRQHVSERAVLGDRVEVTGPSYVGLDVTVTGQARHRYTESGHETAIRTAIESFLHPLTGYDGSGYPIGRSLRIPELRDRVDGLDVVDRLGDITITAHGGTIVDDEIVSISDTSLFSITNVTANFTLVQQNGGEG